MIMASKMIELTDDEKLGTIDGREQYHYEFKDWEDAFRQFYRKKNLEKSFCLVLSTHWVTSGYWVERDARTDEYATVYRSVKAVRSLERRIRDRGEEYMPMLDCRRKEMLNLGGLVR